MKKGGNWGYIIYSTSKTTYSTRILLSIAKWFAVYLGITLRELSQQEKSQL